MITSTLPLEPLIVLLLLANMHGAFGKNLPKIVWYISIASSISIGIFFCLIGSGNIVARIMRGFMFGGVAVIWLIIVRMTRRRHAR